MHGKQEGVPAGPAPREGAGKPRGFELLDDPKEVRKLERKLMTHALLLTDNHVAQSRDLVQETFARALKSRHTFIEGTNIEAWMQMILLNHFRSSLRRNKFWSKGDPEELMRGMAVSGTQESEVSAQQIEELLARVPERYRKALELVRDGYTYDEIGKHFGLGAGAASVKSLMNRARKVFAEVLEEAGYIDSDDVLVRRFLDKEPGKKG